MSDMMRKYHAAILVHEEGVSVSCPELPGCFSQGTDVAEALVNIRDAIGEYLDVFGDPKLGFEMREVQVEAR